MKQEDFLKLFKGTHLFCAGDDKKRSKEKYDEYDWKEDIDKEDFKALNRNKFGIYFAVNKFEKGTRRKDKIKRIRAVFCEDDYTGKLVTDWPIEPSIIVNSSPGKYHYYWLTNTTNFKEYELVMQTMVDKHNCDNHARDISRVLRVPGTYHNKADKFRIKIIGGCLKKYKWDAIKVAFPPANKKKSNYTSNSDGDFDIAVAVKELITAKDIHGSMVSIAMKMANKNIDKDTFNQFMQLAYQNIDSSKLDSKRQQNIEDRFSSVHLDECYDSAVEKIKSEPDQVLIVKSIKKKHAKKNPFPKIILPEPLALQHEEFSKQVPKPFIPELLYPFETSFSTMVLQGKILTPIKGRTLSTLKFPLGSSTIGKDNHSTGILHVLGNQDFGKSKLNELPISNLLRSTANSSSSIESEGALKEEMQALEKYGFFWIYTEGSSRIGLIADSKSTYVKSISSSLIDIYDGQLLKGGRNKKKNGQDNSIPSLEYPFCALLWYTQPELFFSNLTPNMLAQGFAGRGDYYMIKEPPKSEKTVSIFGNSSGEKSFKHPEFDKEYLEYLKFAAFNCAAQEKPIQVKNTGLEILGDWEQDNLLNENKRKDENLQKFISRITMSAEKELSSQAVHEHLWECFKRGKEPFEKDIIISHKLQENIIPWCVHQLYVRENIVFERIGENVNKRREDALYEIMADLINGIRKYSDAENTLGLAGMGYAPKGYLGQMLRDRGTLEFKNAGETNRFLHDLANEGKLVSRKVGRTEYYGYKK